MTYHEDPFDSASDPEVKPFEVFGEISLDAWFVTLKKGVGKRTFDELSDKKEDRRTNVEIYVHGIEAMNLREPLKREVLTTSVAWAKVTWPSLQRLGVANPKEVRNKYCKCKMTGTGRKFTTRDGNQAEETTFEFLALYNSKEECEKAYAARFETEGSEKSEAPTAEQVEKANALKFANAIVKNAKAETGDDFEAFRNLVGQKLASMPITAKFFTADSPEVVDFMTGQM